MGQPIRIRKTYSRPFKHWDATRISEEVRLKNQFGLKNKKEILGAHEILRKFRRVARQTLSMSEEDAKTLQGQIINKLAGLGLLDKEATLDDILSLTVSDILGRRLQTIVYNQGKARTVKQARQLIIHGKVRIDGVRNTAPGTMITKKIEPLITVEKLKEPELPKPAPKKETAEEAPKETPAQEEKPAEKKEETKPKEKKEEIKQEATA